MKHREEIKNIVSEYCSRTTDVNEFGLCEAIYDKLFHILTTLKEEVEGKYGKEGTQTGSLGYQGIVMGIQSFQREEDKMRDYFIFLITEHIKRIKE